VLNNNKNNKFMIAAMAAIIAIPATSFAQDLLIVNIGDSMASGEGNPNSFGPGGAVWTNAPCHRSNNNGRRFASNRINSMSGVSTDYFDFACSGASINAGILGPQVTDQPDANNVVMPPQIDRVVNLQQSLNNRQIDILMISIGVNDANFAPVVSDCLLPDDCRTGSQMNSARATIANLLAARYDQLGAAIRQRLNVRHVYITEYPNLVTRKNATDFCGGFNDFFPAVAELGGGLMSGISEAESAFALANFIRPLNDKIQEAASRNGWRYISGPEDTFSTHGFCTGSDRRYVNTIADSFTRQGTHTGTVHPNIRGHQAYADALVRRATIDFDLPLEDPRVIRKLEANLGAPGNIALPGIRKTVEVEIAQHPGTLTVVIQHRVRTPFLPTPAFSNTTMADIGGGALNLFAAPIPGSENLLPGQTLDYRIRITATRGGNSATTTTSTESIVLGGTLEQE
jgi:lysophospholipase L1-like esterase